MPSAIDTDVISDDKKKECKFVERDIQTVSRLGYLPAGLRLQRARSYDTLLVQSEYRTETDRYLLLPTTKKYLVAIICDTFHHRIDFCVLATRREGLKPR
jgi:hypothetical protein